MRLHFGFIPKQLSQSGLISKRNKSERGAPRCGRTAAIQGFPFDGWSVRGYKVPNNNIYELCNALLFLKQTECDRLSFQCKIRTIFNLGPQQIPNIAINEYFLQRLLPSCPSPPPPLPLCVTLLPRFRLASSQPPTASPPPTSVSPQLTLSLKHRGIINLSPRSQVGSFYLWQYRKKLCLYLDM